MPTSTSSDALKDQIRDKYESLAEGRGESSDSCCCGSERAPDSGIAYMGEPYDGVDGHATEADLGLGCGLPTEIASLRPGEIVLDLGSGAGVDAFVARRAVGAEGRVIGVDFAPKMVEKARRNAEDLGYGNTDFYHGEIEDLPLEAATVDVVISNCVLNLVPSKGRAFYETHRVLRPGGRFIISDIVSVGALPEAIREAAELHAGCVAGALPKGEYLDAVREAGFSGVKVAKERTIDLPGEVLRPHLSEDDLRAFRTSEAGLLSVTVTGRRPAA